MYLIIEIIGSEIVNYNLEKHNRVGFDIPPMEPRTHEGSPHLNRSQALRRTAEFTIYDPFIFGNNKLPQIFVMPSKNNTEQAYCVITNTVFTNQYDETFGPYTTITLDEGCIYNNHYCRLYLAPNNLRDLHLIFKGFYDNLHRQRNPELYDLPPVCGSEDKGEESDWDTT